MHHMHHSQKKTSTSTGGGRRRRIPQQRHRVLHHEGRPQQHLRHRLQHGRDQPQALHQVHGDHPQYHPAARLQVVAGGGGPGPRLSLLQHHGRAQHRYHRGGKTNRYQVSPPPPHAHIPTPHLLICSMLLSPLHACSAIQEGLSIVILITLGLVYPAVIHTVIV